MVLQQRGSAHVRIIVLIAALAGVATLLLSEPGRFTPQPAFAAGVDCRDPHETDAGETCDAYFRGNLVGTINANNINARPGEIVRFTVRVEYPPRQLVVWDPDPQDDLPEHRVINDTGTQNVTLRFPGGRLRDWGASPGIFKFAGQEDTTSIIWHLADDACAQEVDDWGTTRSLCKMPAGSEMWAEFEIQPRSAGLPWYEPITAAEHPFVGWRQATVWFGALTPELGPVAETDESIADTCPTCVSLYGYYPYRYPTPQHIFQFWPIASDPRATVYLLDPQISGVVRDNSGRPLPNIPVQVFKKENPSDQPCQADPRRAADFTQTTNLEGRYLVYVEDPTEYQVCPSNPYAMEPAFRDASVEFIEHAFADFRFDGYRLHGRVEDGSGGDVPDAHIVAVADPPDSEAPDMEAFTDVLGNYEVWVKSGTYNVSAEADLEICPDDFGDCTYTHVRGRPLNISADLSSSDAEANFQVIPDVRLSVEGPDELGIDEQANYTVTITYDPAAASEGAFLPALVEGPIATGAGDVSALIDPETPLPAQVAPGSSAQLRYLVTGAENGPATLAWTVSGQTEGGSSLDAQGSISVRVGGSPLKVEVTPRPVEFSLGELDGNEFFVDVTLTNDSEEELRNVNLVGGDGSPFFMETLREQPGVALEVLELDPDYQVGDLAPQQSVALTYKLRAFDVAHAKLTAIALYSDLQGHPLQANGNAEVKVLSDVMVEVDLRVTRHPVLAGQPMVIAGNVKNVTTDKTIAVGAFPIVSGNAANGILREVGHAPGLPTEVQGWKLEPEAQVDVDGVVRTMFAPHASDANVSYVFAAWILEDDGTRTKLDPTQIKVNREDGAGDLFTARMLPDGPEDDNPYDDCGFDEWYCGVVLGVGNFAAGTLDLAKMVGEGWLAGWTYQWRLMQWTGDMMATAGEALQGNPAAQQALIDEIVLDIETLKNTGIITYDQGVEVAPIVANALGDVVGDVIEVQQTGNWEQLQFELGKFAGENPDLLVEGIFGLARKMAGRKLVTIAADPDSYLKNAMNHMDDVRKAEVERLMRRVEESGEDVTDLLRAGDELSVDAVRRLWGLNDSDLRLLQEIVENENIVLAFRARSPRSAFLVENLLAYEKPELMKIKTVNDIDMNYLGYRREADGIVELVEPGPGLRDFSVDDFKRAESDPGFAAQIDSAVDAEFQRVAPGVDPLSDIGQRIQKRIRQRAEEWPLYRDLTDQWAKDKIDVGYKTGSNGDANLKLGVTDRRAVTKTEITRPGGPRTWEIKMQGRGPDSEFKPVTGDIDLTAIFGRDGRPITDPVKRERIYRKLIEAIGMRHGESFTFEGPGRAGYLSGAGKQVVLQKGEPPRVGEYQPRGSATEDSPNAAKRTGDEGDDFVLITGVKYELQAHEIWTEMAYRSLSSLLWDFTQARIVLFYGKAAWDKVVEGLQESQVNATLDRENGSQFQPDGLGGIKEWVTPSNSTSPLQGREMLQAPGAWLPITLEAALARGNDQIVLAPQTTVWADAPAGATVLEVTSAAYLEFDAASDWFLPGDTVVIDPGGPNEEYAEVSELGSLVLTAPLQRAHAQGEIVLLVIEQTIEPTLTCLDLALSGSEDSAIEGAASCSGSAVTDLQPVSLPVHGQLTVTPEGAVRYVPNPDYYGPDSAVILASGGAGVSAEFTVSWDIVSVNDTPVCSPLDMPATAGSTVTATPSCSDADGDTLQLAISTPPTAGTAAIVDDAVSFAAPATVGTYEFWFVASDGSATSQPARAVSVVSAPPSTGSLTVSAAVITAASGSWPSSLVMVGALKPTGGDRLRCGDDVTLSVDGWSERIPGSRFRKLGSTCVYLKPRSVSGYLLEFGFSTNTGAWSAVGVGAGPSFGDLSESVTIGASVGTVVGSADIGMRWRRQAWTLVR